MQHEEAAGCTAPTTGSRACQVAILSGSSGKERRVGLEKFFARNDRRSISTPALRQGHLFCACVQQHPDDFCAFPGLGDNKGGQSGSFRIPAARPPFSGNPVVHVRTRFYKCGDGFFLAGINGKDQGRCAGRGRIGADVRTAPEPAALPGAPCVPGAVAGRARTAPACMLSHSLPAISEAGREKKMPFEAKSMLRRYLMQAIIGRAPAPSRLALQKLIGAAQSSPQGQTRRRHPHVLPPQGRERMTTAPGQARGKAPRGKAGARPRSEPGREGTAPGGQRRRCAIPARRGDPRHS